MRPSRDSDGSKRKPEPDPYSLRTIAEKNAAEGANRGGIFGSIAGDRQEKVLFSM